MQTAKAINYILTDKLSMLAVVIICFNTLLHYPYLKNILYVFKVHVLDICSLYFMAKFYDFKLSKKLKIVLKKYKIK